MGTSSFVTPVSVCEQIFPLHVACLGSITNPGGNIYILKAHHRLQSLVLSFRLIDILLWDASFLLFGHASG